MTSRSFMISEIDEDSCFNGTDVQAYDIITAIDDTETKSLEELANALLNYKPAIPPRSTCSARTRAA